MSPYPEDRFSDRPGSRWPGTLPLDRSLTFHSGRSRSGLDSTAIEDAVVKTVAGFLNADGGTLLIGIGPDKAVLVLAQRLRRS